ncbi:DUF4381 domain-containing protein [Vibrio ulleungensis]|uniref:DUF4381 domain-containing protein n=1 Tax=Vibrio ulleungensis TaxID=2807619 RepID=A0ABS2HBZ4_9VIBR|nr:DUF4381 domain-containing protein [Vibrio ulleungensis]MBM7035125.1 DUF4381 domain-containing protein [Vibrio ulleungensis]
MFDSLWAALERKIAQIQSFSPFSAIDGDLAANPASLAVLGLLTTLLLAVIVRRRSQKRSRPKQTALRVIALEKQTISPSAAMEVLRQAVRCYYPQSYVDSLSGDAWFTFLDSQAEKPLFKEHSAQWQQAMHPQYQLRREQVDKAALVEQCEAFIHQALPPTRRQKAAAKVAPRA